MHFSDRLIEKIETSSCIVVGIDPNFELMPSFLLPADGKPSSIHQALTRFSQIVIDSVADLVPAVKFQSAYFEQFGTSGVSALSQSIAYAKSNGLLVILDAKRGDIGSTSAAYAKAYLAGTSQIGPSITVSSDLTVDCMTVNPFLGEDSITPFIDIASQFGKGLFVLVKTSNPGSDMIQNQVCDGMRISHQLAQWLQTHALRSKGQRGYSHIGAVVGATYPEEAAILRRLMPDVLFLVPGVGHQGGNMETIRNFFNADGLGAIVPISRAITYCTEADVTQREYQSAVTDRVKSFIQLL